MVASSAPPAAIIITIYIKLAGWPAQFARLDYYICWINNCELLVM
jgi:hypothetical protein